MSIATLLLCCLTGAGVFDVVHVDTDETYWNVFSVDVDGDALVGQPVDGNNAGGTTSEVARKSQQDLFGVQGEVQLAVRALLRIAETNRPRTV